MMHVFHEGSGRFSELVHRLAVCRHGWRRLRAHAVLLFPHCLPPCPDIISLLAKTSQTDPVSRALQVSPQGAGKCSGFDIRILWSSRAEIKGRSLIESKPRAILFLRIASDIVRLPAFAVLLVLAFEPRWANRTEPVP